MTSTDAGGTRDRGRAPLRRRRHGRIPPSKANRQGSAIVISGLAAALTDASPSGTAVGDRLWLLVLGGLGAYLASTAKRGPIIVATIVAVVSSRTVPGLAFAALGIAFAALSTRRLRRRAFFARGIAGGAVVVSLCVSAPHLTWWFLVTAGIAVGIALAGSGLRNADIRIQRRARWIAIGFGAFALVASAAAGLGAASGARDVDAGTTELRLGFAAARQGDTAGAVGHLDLARLHLDDARRAIDRWGLLGRAVPITSQHVDALSSVLRHVEGAADQAARTARTVDSSDLTVHAGLIDTDAIADLEHPLQRLAAALAAVVDDAHDRARDPILPVVKDRLRRLEVEAAKSQHEAFDGARAAATMPRALGAEGLRRYLVLFTSPAEARGRFGFPGSFAEVTFDRGRMALGEHGTTSAVLRDVHADQQNLPIGEQQLRPYVPYGASRSMLSVTIPPDFPTVAASAAELWRSTGRPAVDGVIQLDPASLSPLLAFTGPVRVPTVPTPLTSANLTRFLLLDQYLQFPTDQAPRREVLETVSDLVFERLVNSNMPAPRTLVQTFRVRAQQGHLHVAAFDPDLASFLDEIDLDGRFDPPVEDGVFVANVNTVGNKIDTFLRKDVDYVAEVDGKGHLRGSVKVTLTNAAPARGLPTYVIGSALTPPPPRGTNHTSLLVYTAAEGREVLVDGKHAGSRKLYTGGWWLHEVTVDLPPGATRTVEVQLDGKLDLDGRPYRLGLEPGGGTLPDSYGVRVRWNGGDVTFRGRIATPVTLG